MLLLLLQGRRGQLLLVLLPGHVLRVEEHGGCRGGVVLRLMRRRGTRGGGGRRLGDGLVGGAAGVGGAGRGRRGQDVCGRRRGRGRAVVALALRREGPGGGGSGGRGGGGTQVKRLWLRPEAPLVVRLVVWRKRWLWRANTYKLMTICTIYWIQLVTLQGFG